MIIKRFSCLEVERGSLHRRSFLFRCRQDSVASATLKAAADGDQVGEHSKLEESIDACFAFFNGDITQSVPQHYCKCPAGKKCKDRLHAANKGAVLLYNMTWATGAPQFNPGRWTKQVPALQWWARLACIHLLMGQIYNPANFTPSVHQIAGQNAEQDALQELAGKRLKAGRDRLVQPRASFQLLVFLALFLIMEQFVFLLFGLSNVYVDRHREGDERRTDTHRPRQGRGQWTSTWTDFRGGPPRGLRIGFPWLRALICLAPRQCGTSRRNICTMLNILMLYSTRKQF
jgi:hypothetical protein